MFHFNLSKAIQAVALLIRQPGVDHDRYLKIVKLLYIAERESILETGRPITGDKTVAMPLGTAVSHVVHLIRGEDTRPEWSSTFKTTHSDYRLQALRDPGTELLCQYEVEKLTAVAARHKDDSRWALKDITHELPEYKKNDPGRSSKVIPLADILEAGGKSGHLAAIQKAANADRAFARIFGR